MCVEAWKKKQKAQIIKNRKIAKNVYEMDLQVGDMVREVEPGQFINLYCRSEARLLPRPISVCETDKKQGIIKIVYGVLGKGTKEFSTYEAGETIEILGPLGSGYQISQEAGHSILVGGGLGVPPLVELAQQLEGTIEVYLGFRTEPFLIQEFQKYTDQVYIATDDGSYGKKGTVLDLLKENAPFSKNTTIYSCGPRPMLKNVALWAGDQGLPIQVSLEERMACGVGACVGCVCKIQNQDTEEWEYRRVCKDGPVFNGGEVVWDEES
ncbi:MAG: dihydroorotate dehydrogenase electron transfer subunit [Epulopiscium sp.]|nr:dihydroorotate dehydrogenase electron transfer subunit [Candidatus Epulonipiscium sp.]